MAAGKVSSSVPTITRDNAVLGFSRHFNDLDLIFLVTSVCTFMWASNFADYCKGIGNCCEYEDGCFVQLDSLIT